jgi:hypothetical protein
MAFNLEDAPSAILDGAFELWDSPTDPTHWTVANVLDHTITQVASPNQYAGTYAMSVTRLTANYADVRPKVSPRLVPGGWYHVQFAAKASGVLVGALRFQAWNATAARGCDSTGLSWILGSEGSTDLFLGDFSTSWAFYSGLWFQWAPWFGLNDQFQPRFAGYYGVGNTAYYDSLDIRGPFATPLTAGRYQGAGVSSRRVGW